jgi:hypothetical protein
MANVGLSRVQSEDLKRLYRLLHRGFFAGTLTRARLIELAFGHLEAELDALVGKEPAVAQALIAAVLAERSHLKAEPPALQYCGVLAPGTRSRDVLEQVRELLGGALESALLFGLGVGDDRRLMKALSAVMEGRHLKVRLVLDAHGKDDPLAAARAFLAQHFGEHRCTGDQLEALVSVDAHLTARVVVVDARRVLVTSGDLTTLEDDQRIDVGAVFDAPSYAKALHEECERMIASGALRRL